MQGQHEGQIEPVLLGQKQIMQMVKQYLGSTLFRNAHKYEAVTSNHAKYLEFTIHKVELAEEGATQYQDITVQSLLLGSNQGLWLSLQILRTVQYGHVLLCLAVNQIEPYSKNRHTVLAVIFNSRQSARLGAQKYSFLTILRVKDPHKSIHKAYGSLPLVLTRTENIVIKQSFRLHPQYPETFKNEGNSKFKEKNFEQALLLYEIGLGLLQQSDKKRDRAVLYANSSHCLYGMKLYQSAYIYAETSIALDKNYIKGFFRKLNCLLQLDLKQVPRVLCSIDILAPAQSEQAVGKYTQYMTNHSGIFNWTQMLTTDSPVFGEYTTSKIILKQTGKGEYCFRANNLIHQHQLIIVHKPLIAKKSYQQRFGEQYTRLTQQIQVFSRYQQLFYRRFSQLPYQKTLQGQPLTFQPSHSSELLQLNEIHAKCLRCLELQKTIEIVNTTARTQILGIWEKLYAFQHECLANCNYIHIKGALVVFALRDIKPDEYLSLDFLNWETVNRKQFMLQKLSKTCSCAFCQINWPGLQGSLPLQIDKLLQQTHDSQACQKVSLFIMWNLIFEKQIAEVELMREYLMLLEKYPLWQCVMNCLRYLRTKSKNDLFDLIKSTLKRIMQRYFKITHQQAVDLLKSLI